jgi:hypothetical protein
MKKIEKLDGIKHSTFNNFKGMKNYRIVDMDTVLVMAEKINEIIERQGEIIDVLNSRLFQPTITVPSSDQKQPEGVEYEKRIRVLGELSGNKPEKQEEWRERIRREVENGWVAESIIKEVEELLSTEYFRGVKNGTEGKFYEKITIKSEVPKEIIDELLSERTFTKEELEVIEEWWGGMLYSVSPDKRDDQVHDKLSKLLKEEE